MDDFPIRKMTLGMLGADDLQMADSVNARTLEPLQCRSTELTPLGLHTGNLLQIPGSAYSAAVASTPSMTAVSSRLVGRGGAGEASLAPLGFEKTDVRGQFGERDM